MDTTTAPTQAARQPVLKSNQILITGRIDSVRSFDSLGRRLFEHRVVLPSVDQYTPPNFILVQAALKLGSPGDDLKAVCQISGFRDRFKTKDGEIVETARMMLRAVD